MVKNRKWHIYNAVCIVMTLVGAVGVWMAASKLFLPTAMEVLLAVVPSGSLTLVGVAGVGIGTKVRKAYERRLRTRKAIPVAQTGYISQIFTFEEAHKELNAFLTSLETNDLVENAIMMSNLKEIVYGVGDLSKMSSYFEVQYYDFIYASMREAINKVDANKLAYLSDFIRYCKTVTNFEVMSKHFNDAVARVLTEVRGTLDLYASLRSMLHEYKRSEEADRESLRNEVEKIGLRF